MRNFDSILPFNLLYSNLSKVPLNTPPPVFSTHRLHFFDHLSNRFDLTQKIRKVFKTWKFPSSCFLIFREMSQKVDTKQLLYLVSSVENFLFVPYRRSIDLEIFQVIIKFPHPCVYAAAMGPSREKSYRDTIPSLVIHRYSL